MERVNITLSLPKDSVERVTSILGESAFYEFSTNAVIEALEKKDDELKRAYSASLEDSEQHDVERDWGDWESE